MGESGPGSAREEAERLVATALAAARTAAAGLGTGPTSSGGPVSGLISDLLGRLGGPEGSTGAEPTGAGPAAGSPAAEPAGGSAGHRFATGSAECCVCPICRAMAALRDPSPEFAERLATGAGDLAAGVASLLRAFATAGPPPPQPPPAAAPATDPPPRQQPPTGAAADDSDQVWRAATRTGHDSRPEPARDVWSAATTAASRSDASRVTSPVEPTGGSPKVPAARAPEAPTGADEGAPGDEA